MAYETSSILTWLILVPLIGALMILLIPATQVRLIRGTALAFCLGALALATAAAFMFDWHAPGPYGSNVQLKQDLLWIPSLNIHYAVGVDGLSLPLVLLTAVIGLFACVASLSITEKVKGYFALFLLLLSGLLGTFLAMDLLLFYIFFEVSLYPMFFLIGIWGGPRREYAAIKFFLFTLVGSIAILIAIVGIYYFVSKLPGHEHGTFNLITLATDPAIRQLFRGGYETSAGRFAYLAFWLLFVGFAIKLPTVPFHTWLPDAHVEAPTPVSMMLAAVLLKMGGYGLLRVSYPLFPVQAAHSWFWVGLVGVASMIYGGLCAMAQKDFKRLVAYSSVSHMGYVVLGIAVMNQAGANGALFQMIGHGISSAMMFFIVGVVYDRAHHRDLARLGGLATQMPNYFGLSIVGFLASMGLPGLCGFVGELMVLLGTFSAIGAGSVLMTFSGNTAGTYRALVAFGVLAAFAVILTTGYLLWTFQRVFFGTARPEFHHFTPLSSREKFVLYGLALGALLFGVLPGAALLDHVKPTMDAVVALMRGT